MTCKENVEKIAVDWNGRIAKKIVKNKCRILQPFHLNSINIFMSYKRLEIMKIAVIYDFRVTVINLKILARISASADFDRTFSMYITGINLQNVSFRFSLQTQLRRL